MEGRPPANALPPRSPWLTMEYHPQMITTPLNPHSEKALIPKLFVDDYRMSLRPIVQFKDPAGNIVDISVKATLQFLYFTDGWKELKNVYPIPNGGSIFLKYESPSLFVIFVLDRTLHEITYPTPPARFLNVKTCIQDLFLNQPTRVPHIFPRFDPDRTTCILTYKIKISHTQSRGRNMTLDPPFTTHIFSTTREHLTMVDEEGNQYPVELVWARPYSEKALFVTGWQEFCQRRMLCPNSVVEFGALWLSQLSLC
ncbi:DNA-binding barrel domain superfamily [Sesbania bispinosa]|nr:DNA-binding barrel domain superfamily [Sesbania bispinosa]